jgi:casein kinase II subunit beta
MDKVSRVLEEKTAATRSEDNWDTVSSTSSKDVSWVEWFCKQKGNRFFCQVPASWIEGTNLSNTKQNGVRLHHEDNSDSFNLYGLSDLVPYYHDALNIILDLEEDYDEEDKSIKNRHDIEEYNDVIEASAEFLYGTRFLLIHAHFVHSLTVC